ncbi:MULTISPECIES: RHS repeat-associated core domain-containing protein [Caldilinea]|uniref:RHS repeat-associated core domain-containing protein n=1 Tax=Caldilinea TaxID=233191 RepID=UPI001E3CA40A|nr:MULTISPECIES: RHS repeat-associated core domain-containing protein [Caldilinea]
MLSNKISASSTSWAHSTGQREEAALGLYFYNARWYDPALGHFLSPDTLPPVPGGCPPHRGDGGAGSRQCAGLSSLCVCAV